MLHLCVEDKVTSQEHSKALTLIQCKKLEHVALKEQIDPCSHMLPTTHKWDQIIKFAKGQKIKSPLQWKNMQR